MIEGVQFWQTRIQQAGGAAILVNVPGDASDICDVPVLDISRYAE
jgi:hypothetical protein